MQAVVVSKTGGPEVLQDHPVPRRGPHQVLVRVHSSSVNPVDTQLRAGTLPPAVGGPGALEGKYPKVTECHSVAFRRALLHGTSHYYTPSCIASPRNGALLQP